MKHTFSKLFFGLMFVVAGSIIPVDVAKADTFSFFTLFNTEVVVTANLNKNTFTPGETIITTGSLFTNECANLSPNVILTAQIVDPHRVASYETVSLLDGTTRFVGGVTLYGSAVFVAPSTPGEYNMNFTAGWSMSDPTNDGRASYAEHQIPFTVISPPEPPIIPVPPGNIQGYKVNSARQYDAAFNGQTITAVGGNQPPSVGTNPYLIAGLIPSTYNVTTDVPVGHVASYCIGNSCGSGVYTTGTTANVTVPSGGAVGLWWMYTPVPPPTPTVSCAVSPSTIPIGGSATWTATASGGTGPYTYAWSGTDGLTGATKSVAKTYDSAGPKSAFITVTDSNEATTGVVSCSLTAGEVIVTVLPPPTNPVSSCSANGTLGTFSWTAPAGYDMFYTRVSSNGGNLMPLWKNDFVGTTYTFTTTPGQSYVWWVHTKSPITDAYSTQIGGTIVCPLVSTTPTVSCAVSPSTISKGGSATWNATASGGTGTYTYAWSGTDGLTGATKSVAKTYNATGIKSASVTVTDSGSPPASTGAVSCATTVTVILPPTAVLEARKYPYLEAFSPLDLTITSGEKVALQWSSTNATVCIGENFSTSQVSTGGATAATVGTVSDVDPTPSPRTYTVRCYNAARDSATDSLTVTTAGTSIAGTPTLIVTPNRVRYGEPTTVYGDLNGNTGCTLSSPTHSTITVSGGVSAPNPYSYSMSNIQGETTFTLTCPLKTPVTGVVRVLASPREI